MPTSWPSAGATMSPMLLFAASAADSVAAQVLQIVGALLILSGFIAAQRGLLDVASRTYLIVNLVGSALLATLAGLGGQLGFLLLNTVWAVISLVSLVRGPRPAS